MGTFNPDGTWTSEVPGSQPTAPALPNYAELTPAYGRDYATAKGAKDAFLGGADFRYAATGQYASIRDVTAGNTVLLRYKRLAGVTTLKVTVSQQLRASDAVIHDEPGPDEVRHFDLEQGRWIAGAR